jgi:hypothetical protein
MCHCNCGCWTCWAGVCECITPCPSPPWCGCQPDSAADEMCANGVWYIYSMLNSKYYLYITLGYVVIQDVEVYGSSINEILVALAEMYYPNEWKSYFLDGYTVSTTVPTSSQEQLGTTLNAANCYLYCSDLQTNNGIYHDSAPFSAIVGCTNPCPNPPGTLD